MADAIGTATDEVWKSTPKHKEIVQEEQEVFRLGPLRLTRMVTREIEVPDMIVKPDIPSGANKIMIPRVG